MTHQDATLKCSWKNGIIWAAIMSAAAAGLHYLMWYITIGPLPEEIVRDDAYYMTQVLLIASFLLPVILYLFMYRGYMKIAGRHPHQLAAVARDEHGKPGLWTLIILAVLEVLWAIVTTVIVYVFFDIDAGDMVVIECYAMASVGNLVLDVILFLLGKRFFKPDRVQDNH